MFVLEISIDRVALEELRVVSSHGARGGVREISGLSAQVERVERQVPVREEGSA